jgi:hypothetical protein
MPTSRSRMADHSALGLLRPRRGCGNLAHPGRLLGAGKGIRGVRAEIFGEKPVGLAGWHCGSGFGAVDSGIHPTRRVVLDRPDGRRRSMADAASASIRGHDEPVSNPSRACSHYPECGDGGHFAVRQGAESAVYSLYISEQQHRRGPGKRRMIWPRTFGLLPKAGHAALLVVRLESLNLSPRALPGPLWGGNATIRIV